MKKTKRMKVRNGAMLLVVILLTMSLFTACGTETNTVTRYYDLDVIEATPDFYINDFAGVFSEEQKAELMTKAIQFDEEYSGIQVVITTVEHLRDAVIGYELVVKDQNGNTDNESQAAEAKEKEFTIEEIAYSMYSQYGIGQDDMGILILFSTLDREVRIETGRQMQFYITDSVSGRLLDNYGMDYFAEDQFAEGLISLQIGTIDKIKELVPKDWQSAGNSSMEKTKIKNDNAAESSNVADQDADSITKKSEKDNTGKGILCGFLGSVFVAISAFVAFIRQKFKGDAERKNLEEVNQAEIKTLRSEFQERLNQKDRLHEQYVSNLNNTHQSAIKEKESTIIGLRQELRETSSNIRTLTIQLESMTDKYNRVQRLHPEYKFDDEVNEMIESEYKATAEEIDAELADFLATPAAKDKIEFFSKALLLIESAEPDVRKYVTSDKKVLKNLYDESVRLKREFDRLEQEKRDKAATQDAYKRIKGICDNNPNGNYQTYEALHSALTTFFALTPAQKAFFPDNSLIEKLKKVYNVAECDYIDYTQACQAEDKVCSIIGRMSSADEDDRDKLSRAKGYFNNLTGRQKDYFSQELLSKLNRLIKDADDDHRLQERRRDDEKRRRQAAMSHSYSYHSSSSSHHTSSPSHHYGGHGGRPSGGGASRKF